MDKEALKQKRLENLKRGREAKKQAKLETKVTETPETQAAPTAVPPAPPPPLEPMGALPPISSSGGAPVTSAGLINPAQAKSLGKIANNYFKGVTTGANLLVKKSGIELTVTNLEEAEEELLGSFMIPVINKYLPKFQDSPEYALAVVAVGLYLGKIKVKKIEKPVNLGDQKPTPEPELFDAKVPPPVSTGPRKGLNLGNLEEK